jgi:hypothetical protein
MTKAVSFINNDCKMVRVCVWGEGRGKVAVGLLGELVI